MRRIPAAGLAALALTLAAAAASQPGAAPTAPPPGSITFLISGRGYGHGIGMSQYGARGYAEQGGTFAQILQHYSPQTTPGTAPVASIRVLVAEHARRLVLSSATALRV